MAGIEVKRGEVWIVDLGIAQKVRPAVIFSVAYLDHERALITYVPRTTSVRETRFEVTHETTTKKSIWAPSANNLALIS